MCTGIRALLLYLGPNSGRVGIGPRPPLESRKKFHVIDKNENRSGGDRKRKAKAK